ncbi:DoxX family protein [Kineococcus terrestris]|uniref:DoxX family protein n=1 Tax=Kineococcus terrestris TaxID=2044856 RepID=UPI0034DAF2DD
MSGRTVGGALRRVAQVALGVALLGAGTGHLTTLREEFQAQVPPWLPLDPDLVVVASGVVEIVLGAALLAVHRQPARAVTGAVVAAFFVAVFPGNVSQYLTGTDAFGLDTDTARAVRLAGQPVLVLWALWSTRAWGTWRERRAARER